MNSDETFPHPPIIRQWVRDWTTATPEEIADRKSEIWNFHLLHSNEILNPDLCEWDLENGFVREKPKPTPPPQPPITNASELVGLALELQDLNRRLTEALNRAFPSEDDV